MSLKYKTNIEITSPAANKDEAMEIVGDYLSGNIVSGIEMKCTTTPVRFYSHTAVKVAAIVLLVTVGFLSGVKAKPHHSLVVGICATDAVTPPLKTSEASRNDAEFKKAWQEKQTREALSFIKK